MAAPAFVHLALALLLAPLLPGVADRVKAWFGGRRGRPLLQRYLDIARLLRKGAVVSTVTGPLFALGPIAAVAAPAVALAFLPAGGTAPLFFFPGDIFLLLGLLAFSRFATVAASLDPGSSFTGMGGSREAAFSALVEPVLFLAFLSLARQTGEISLARAFHTLSPGEWQSHAAVLALLSGALFCVLLAENSRVPVDDPNTHLELTMVHEAMVLEHSGPDLAAITYGACLKLYIFASLLASVAGPARTGDPWLDGGAHLAGVVAAAALVGAAESVTARLRLTAVPHFIAVGGAFAFLSLLLLVR